MPNIDPNNTQVSIEQEHFRIHQGKMFRIYDSQSILTGGTPLINQNFNRNSPIVSLCTCSRGATASADGTEFIGIYLPGTTGTGQSTSGTELSGSYEYNLKSNTTYMFRFTNGSSSTNIASWTLSWYEAL